MRITPNKTKDTSLDSVILDNVMQYEMSYGVHEATTLKLVLYASEEVVQKVLNRISEPGFHTQYKPLTYLQGNYDLGN